MQKLELKDFTIRKSKEGETALIIPSVNDMEYIQSLSEVRFVVNDDTLEILYVFNEEIERELHLKDISIGASFYLKNIEELHIFEIGEEEFFYIAKK